MEIQAIHRIRSFYVTQKTAMMNRMRGILLEMGMAIPKGKSALMNQIRTLLEPENDSLNLEIKNIVQGLYHDLKNTNEPLEIHTSSLEKLAKEDELCKRIETLPGIGSITATALMAKIGNGSEFKQGRELSAYLELVPRQHSSGEKKVLQGISKHGDRYVRPLLIHGGRSALKAALRIHTQTKLYEKNDKHSQWIRRLAERIGKNKTSVAIANKNARMVLALLKKQMDFQAELAH